MLTRRSIAIVIMVMGTACSGSATTDLTAEAPSTTATPTTAPSTTATPTTAAIPSTVVATSTTTQASTTIAEQTTTSEQTELPTYELDSTIELESVPFGLIQVDDTVWVTAVTDQSVLVLDRFTGDLITEVDTPGRPHTLIEVGGEIWVNSWLDDQIMVMDPISREISDIIPVDPSPSVMLVVDDTVWVSTGNGHTLEIIDATTHEILKSIRTPKGIRDMRLVNDQIWATTIDAVLAMDPGTGRIVSEVDLGPSEYLLEVDGRVWITHWSGSIAIWDPQIGSYVGVAETPAFSSRIVANDHFVFQASEMATSEKADATISVIDPSTGRITQSLPYAYGSGRILPIGEYIWVTDPHNETILIFGPVR